MRASVGSVDLQQGRYRNLWRYYFRQCDGIVYVVDSADAARLPVAYAELRLLLSDDALVRRRPQLPLLVVANKSDRSSSTDNFRRFAYAVRARCQETGRPCHVVAGCELAADGLTGGFEWLASRVGATGSRWRRDKRPTWYHHKTNIKMQKDVPASLRDGTKERIISSNLCHCD